MDEEYLFSTKVNSTFITVCRIFSYVYIHICLSIQTTNTTSDTTTSPGPSLYLRLLHLSCPLSVMIGIVVRADATYHNPMLSHSIEEEVMWSLGSRAFFHGKGWKA